MKKIYYFLFVVSFVLGCQSPPSQSSEKDSKKYASENIKKRKIIKLVSEKSGVHSKDLIYKVKGSKFKGYFVKGKAKRVRPAILLLPEHWGLTDDMKRKAKSFAKKGFAVFVTDFYGGQKHTDNPDKAQNWLDKFTGKSGKPAMNHLLAAIDVLKNKKNVDSQNIFVVGYTFGGALATEFARRGYKVAGVINIHGAVGSRGKAKPGYVQSPIFWIKGQYDAYVPKKMEKAFRKEMGDAQAKIKVVTLPNGFNGFSNPKASEIGKKFQMPIKYDRKLSALAEEKALNFMRKTMR